ncbi:hypothetical protein [Tenggerimyces flavus]|uniref:Arsenate reductase n=1 Tax=Tenggerimyces flavus TaxID=1708749 RepID=A0ABV7YL02_9ACTN|nr:hypothetical protein [Tenggerimyces flavus]MBM7786567.1 hypothetical protein [Tenggerimyces flavus]
MTSSIHDGLAAEGTLAWVDTASPTLPTAEQPIRVAEFNDLFATAVRAVDRVDSTTLRLTFDALAEERAPDLAARETNCCSFFNFDFMPADHDRVTMQVAVPNAYVAVLDGLAARAAAGAA